MKLDSLEILETKIDEPQHIIYVVSYPNSGRTWLRSLLSRYKQLLVGVDDFHIKLHALHLKEPYTPQYIFYHAGSGDLDRPYPWISRLFRRPIVFNFDLTPCEDSRILFLVRSPKNTLISNYHEMSTRQKRFTGSLSQFIRDAQFGLNRWIQFHNYIHASLTGDDTALLISYSELRRETAKQLERILEFSGTKVTSPLLDNAVSFSSLDNMRKLEMSNQLIRPAHRDADVNADTLKVRAGSLDSWRDILNARDINYIDARLKTELVPFYLNRGLDWF